MTNLLPRGGAVVDVKRRNPLMRRDFFSVRYRHKEKFIFDEGK